MELLTPLELSRILKLHPFTVTRLAREGLSALPADARQQAGVPGTAQAGKLPGFSADPPRQVVTAGRGGGSAPPQNVGEFGGQHTALLWEWL